MTAELLEGRRIIDSGRWAVLGCRITASRWPRYDDAWRAARYLDLYGCGAFPCHGCHRVIDTRRAKP